MLGRRNTIHPLTELPRDLPILERDAVRVVVRDIRVSAAQVGEPSWRRTASFRHRHLRHVQHEEPFYPRSLPTLLQRFLDGDAIDEPFELWS